eukprot:CAMPEP_0116021180 /NCGR_PEP_ID=MMETSP0321-20121206/10230_1 /TAXON_ID=163516 /ORGANISM="Leptocylindrus danicus var. danicus, Strain B650" /LENGTH=660 /DNA_ID=CAMNT_0003491995 /DNA_START=96 /DNA_END=2078 /DNA_ORIENTATION=+
MHTRAVASRRAALEDKRRRLEQIKARRNQRGTEQQKQAEESSSDNNNNAANSLDEYIDGLLAAPKPALPTQTQTQTTDESSSVEKEDVVKKDETVQKNQDQMSTSSVVVAVQRPAVETFEMGTQTDDLLPASWDDDDSNNDNDDDDGKQQDAEESKIADNDNDNNHDHKDEVIVASAELTSDQREVYVQTPRFGQFLHAASKKMEKLLIDTPSVAEYLWNVDYTKERTSEEVKIDADDGAGMVSARAVYQCNEWTSGRKATCIDWSNTYKELLLVGYHQPKSSSISLPLPTPPVDPSAMSASAQLSNMVPNSASMHKGSIAAVTDGLALVWNLALTNRPEHIFTCWSPVIACKFHPTEPHLAIGGCHSGQIVLWDVRAGRLPVQKSALGITANATVRGHNYPISALEVTDGGSALVTSDTEGKLNFWSLSNLREPAESLTLSSSNISALSVSADSSSILCGDDNGSLYSIMASSAAATSTSARSSKRLQKKFETSDETGHFSMITAIAAKNGGGSNRSGQFAKGAAGLVLTCGVDWTTKVWAPAYSESPVLSFLSHSYDYMCDVQWSPTHPCVFATASSNGRLGLWNLASSLEEPLSGDGIRVGGEALNTLRWSGDGRRIAVTSGDELHVLGLTEDVTKVKGEEETQMMENFSSRKLFGP